MAEKFLCTGCKKAVARTADDRYYKHKGEDGRPCPDSQVVIPEHLRRPVPAGADPAVPVEGLDYAACRECGRNVELAADGALAAHDRVLRGGNYCPASGTAYRPPEEPCPSAATTAAPAASKAIPAGGAADASAGASTTSPSSPPSPASRSTPVVFSQPSRAGVGASSAAELFTQPSAGTRRPQAPAEQPMTAVGAEIAARLKETFYAYTNRTERSQQATLGPSQIGTPCDRRLALQLLRVPPVNPGGDNWASFVGTCVHAGLAEMLQWADAGTGRYAVELPLTFPSQYVPRGTGDALDRVLALFADHKLMGTWSLNKLRTCGPPPAYRVQVHTYALGARSRGERIEHVAVIGWPRQGSSLDELYVWAEPYDPSIARDALARVERIAERILPQAASGRAPLAVAGDLPAADDCRFCPFFAPGDSDMTRGCPGLA